MEIKFGEGKTKFGPGVEVKMSGNEVAQAISAYLVAHGIYVNGPRIITVNGNLCKKGSVYIDPSGFLINNGEKWSGRGEKD